MRKSRSRPDIRAGGPLVWVGGNAGNSPVQSLVFNPEVGNHLRIGLAPTRSVGWRIETSARDKDPAMQNHRPSPGDVTVLLQEARRGNVAALDQVLPLVYEELRRLARKKIRA
jgi:hypothetical protein